jgi:Ca2+-binding RTX toxin-like protein
VVTSWCVGLLALAPVGALATPGWAAPADTCFGERATITGSGIIDGTAGSDVIVGSDGGDTIDARSGNDLICGLAGDDVVVGGLGNDR